MIIIYLKGIWFIYLLSTEKLLHHHSLNSMFKGTIFFVRSFNENGRIQAIYDISIYFSFLYILILYYTFLKFDRFGTRSIGSVKHLQNKF